MHCCPLQPTTADNGQLPITTFAATTIRQHWPVGKLPINTIRVPCPHRAVCRKLISPRIIPSPNSISNIVIFSWWQPPKRNWMSVRRIWQEPAPRWLREMKGGNGIVESIRNPLNRWTTNSPFISWLPFRANPSSPNYFSLWFCADRIGTVINFSIPKKKN